MTTDPGDLVLDPTCGSGTTAYVAEQWGRRWITIDTSRIALNIAKRRLATALYPYYELFNKDSQDIRQGFVYKKIPHITAKAQANNEQFDEEVLYDQPEENKRKIRVSGPFTVETLQSCNVTNPDEVDNSTDEAEENRLFQERIFSHLQTSGIRNGDKTQQAIFHGVEAVSDPFLNAKGYYNEDESRPFHPNDGTRPRAFRDIPGLHQIALFAEDQFTYNINKVNRLRLGLGLRFTAMQPFADVATTALSPRVNGVFTVAKWIDVRAGIGLNSKTPGLNYLYPDKKYDDRQAAIYISQSAPENNIVNYYTHVYDVAYSKNLKNATTTKIEVGLDFKLPGNRRLSVLAYRDKTPNGFGSLTEYLTYPANIYYTQQDKDNLSGLVITPGQPTQIGTNPIRTDIIFMTTGRIGNTNTTVNKGMEFDLELGQLKPLRTSLYLSGAWSETKTWSTDMDSQTPNSVPTSYAKGINLTPFKVVYPTGGEFTRYRRLVTTLRAVTHIPPLHMVASLTAQAIWHNSNWSYADEEMPIGWIDRDVNYHEITADMHNGYLGMDGRYYAAAPAGQESMAISAMNRKSNDNEPSKTPITWNTSARLTKELGRMGQLSLYVNNALFYEPYLRNNTTTTLTQRNTGTFQFGAELSLNL